MIVDIILDRKDGVPYREEHMKDIYDQAMFFEYMNLASVLDSGTEEDIKQALKNYIDNEGYRQDIKEYIDSVNWLV